MHSLIRFTAFLAILFVLVAALPAQDFRATLLGHVTDPSGAAIPNANVRAINTATNDIKETKTTAEGYYTIPFLIPGTYNVEVTATGFEALHRDGIIIRVADKLELPLQLTVGQMSQEITVVGQQELLETADASRGLVFDPIKTQEYPLNGRQEYMLLALTPGVIFTTETFGPTGNSGTRAWDVTSSYKINGARSGNNLFLLNGAPISDAGGTWQLAPNVEAVQEFKVMSNTYDAAYGRFQGGVVNTTLKSGSNDWHGDVFDYWRNRVLDSNSFQNNYIGRPRGKHNQHQFGGIVGGPIRKNKDFLLASFEGWRERLPVPTTSDVPNNALRDPANQQWSAFGYKIYDPLTTHACGASNEPCSSSAYWRTQFTGNTIPASRISPIGLKILSYYPSANASGLTQNFVANGNTARYFYNQPMGRWDHVFNDNNKLYALFTFQHGQEYRDSTGFGPPAGSGDVGSQRTDQNWITAFNHVINPTTVLDVRASFGRLTAIFPRYTDFSLTADKLGMTGMIHAPTFTQNTVPVINLGGFGQPLFGFNGAGTLQSWNTYNQANLGPSLTMVRGTHTIHTGFEYNYVSRGDASYGWSNGNFTFDQFWTQQQSGRNTGTFDGSSIAGLMLGLPTSGTIDYSATYYRSRPYWAVFVQDDWKITPRLSLNLGLRYEVQVPYIERYNRADRSFDVYTKNPLSDAVLAKWGQLKAQYDATNPKYPYPVVPSVLTGSLLFAGVNGQPSRIYNTDWFEFGPRLGVAYRIDNKTVLRAGGGVFYNTPTNTQLTSGFSQSTPYTNSLDGLTPSACSSGNCLTGPYSLQQPFPQGIATPPGSSAGALAAIGTGISFEPPSNKTPHTYQYSFGFQRELPGHIVAEASYSGNYQNHTNVTYQMDNVNLDQFTLGHNDPTFLSRSLQNPFYGILPTTSNVGGSPTISAQNLLRPFPLWNGLTNNLIQVGHYRSDALQVKIEKRILGGEKTGALTWVLSYTFGKSMQADHRFENWNLAEPLAYEIDDQDKTHNLAFSGVWDLPFGKDRKFFTSRPATALIGDWRMVWTFTYVSGYPVGWPNLVNFCGTWHATNQNQYSWFNNTKSCYQTQPSNTLRPMSDRFSDIRNPSEPQLNLALDKTIPLTERYKFQIRAEAFNLTNTPIRPGPSTSFTDPRFGMLPLMQNNFPRVIQLSGKFQF